MQCCARCHTLAALAIVLIANGLSARADDWPQWRGPDRNGKSRETGLLRQWPADGPRLIYRVDGLGGGYSTPAVVGDRVYLLNNEGDADEFVRCVNARDGSEIWSVRIGAVGNPGQRPSYPGARSTPTVIGDLLYAFGSDGDLACLETQSGSVRWRHNVREEFGGKYGEWAYSESPLVDGEVVVCTPGGSEATLLALDAATGDVNWKCPIPGGDAAAYSSIVVSQAGGLRQYVQFLQHGVVGVKADTGEFLWRYEKTASGSPANIPTPVASGNLVYSASNRGGAGLVRLAVNGSQVSAEEVYFNQRLPKSIGGSVHVDQHLYGTTNDGLVCAEFDSGDVLWQNRSIGPASVLYADGLLVLHGENGEVALVEATPEEYRERGRFTPPERPDTGRSKAWTYPVLANGRLYIHDYGTLWCYQVAGGE